MLNLKQKHELCFWSNTVFVMLIKLQYTGHRNLALTVAVIFENGHSGRCQMRWNLALNVNQNSIQICPTYPHLPQKSTNKCTGNGNKFPCLVSSKNFIKCHIQCILTLQRYNIPDILLYCENTVVRIQATSHSKGKSFPTTEWTSCDQV